MKTQRNQSQLRDDFMGRKLAIKLLTAQAPVHTCFLWLRFPRALDQFDLVALRRVDERDFTAAS